MGRIDPNQPRIHNPHGTENQRYGGYVSKPGERGRGKQKNGFRVRIIIHSLIENVFYPIRVLQMVL
jgi:hypothetical protein